MSRFMLALAFAVVLPVIADVSVPVEGETPEQKLEKQAQQQHWDMMKKREVKAQQAWKQASTEVQQQWPWSDWYYQDIVPALIKLSKIRKNLYANNIFDTYATRPDSSKIYCSPDDDQRFRRPDGTCNDFKDPTMGAVWTRLGRNINPKASLTNESKILYPNPREISRELLTRDSFKEVPFLNLLAVAWIQYMTHDWFSHGDNADTTAYPPFVIKLAPNDPLGSEMMVARTRLDQTFKSSEQSAIPSKTFLNEVTHWWDGSQLYGSSNQQLVTLRKFVGGELHINANGRLPLNMFGVENTGFNRNWWLGLDLLHHLFTLEHNAIARMLAKAHPEFTDNMIFQRARMINAALMAKIHTIEWTPGILPNRTLTRAMNANWKGLVNDSKKVSTWYELFNSDFLFGIVGGKKDLSGVPFSMTEEFVSVYRMHPLLPDQILMRTLNQPKQILATVDLNDTREAKAAALLDKYGMATSLYSFGHAKPGALTLNNYPAALQNIDLPLMGKVDMGTIDLIRDRERGVPRYNEFRRQLKLKALKSFDELTPDQQVVAKLRKLYNNNIEDLDLLIGCLAEGHRPTGYGFGETAFQVFIIMASRRLVADRFYTESYNAETYTKEGIQWIDRESFKSVLLRHFPELKPALYGIPNAFAPWK